MAQIASCTVLETKECGDATVVLFSCGARVFFQFFQHDLPIQWAPFIDTTITIQNREVTMTSAPCPRHEGFDQAITLWCINSKAWIFTPCWLAVRAENDRSIPWKWSGWARQILGDAEAKPCVAVSSKETAIAPQHSLYDVSPDFYQGSFPIELYQSTIQPPDWISGSSSASLTDDCCIPPFTYHTNMIDTYVKADTSDQLFPSSLYSMATPAASPYLSMKSFAPALVEPTAEEGTKDACVNSADEAKPVSARTPRRPNHTGRTRKQKNGVTKRYVSKSKILKPGKASTGVNS